MNKLKMTLTVVICITLIPLLYSQSSPCKVLLKEISTEYKGKCLNGLAHGKGKAKGKDSYVGYFKKGLPDGKGKYIYENGNIYNGYWKDGLIHGKGQFDYSISGVSYTQKGYWNQGDYVGTTDPEVAYRVTGTTGILRHEVKRSEGQNEIIVISIISAMTKFVPTDININKTSGQVMQAGKTFEISNMHYPFNCDIEYSIKVAEDRKLCKFKIEILQKGRYEINLYND